MSLAQWSASCKTGYVCFRGSRRPMPIGDDNKKAKKKQYQAIVLSFFELCSSSALRDANTSCRV